MIAKIKQAVGAEGQAALHADRPGRSAAVHRRQRWTAPRPSRTCRSSAAPGSGRTSCSSPPARTPCPAPPLLQRLQGRFPVTVELQDTDVEQVTREVVLKKKPSRRADLKKLLEDHSGEIERQLSSTKIAFTGPRPAAARAGLSDLARAAAVLGAGAAGGGQGRHGCPTPHPALDRLRRRQEDRRPAAGQRRRAPPSSIDAHQDPGAPVGRPACRKSPRRSPGRSRKTTASFATSSAP